MKAKICQPNSKFKTVKIPADYQELQRCQHRYNLQNSDIIIIWLNEASGYNGFVLKGSDRLCIVVELSMQYCGQII